MSTIIQKLRLPKGQRVSGRECPQHMHSKPTMTDSPVKRGTWNRPQLVSWDDVIGRR